MTTLEEIQLAVANLSPEELAQFRKWFLEWEAEAWDKELEADAQAGRLDFLAEEALQDYQAGRVHKL